MEEVNTARGDLRTEPDGTQRAWAGLGRGTLRETQPARGTF